MEEGQVVKTLVVTHDNLQVFSDENIDIYMKGGSNCSSTMLEKGSVLFVVGPSTFVETYRDYKTNKLTESLADETICLCTLGRVWVKNVDIEEYCQEVGEL